MAYTPDQIKQFIQQKGIASDPYAISNFAKQYGVSDQEVANAMGYTPEQVKSFRGNLWGFQDRATGAATDADVQRTMGGGVDFSAADPHKAFAAAQLNHWTPQQADAALGLQPGQAAQWAQQQGLTWGNWGAPSAQPARPPTLPGAGGPPPSRPANPYMPNQTNSPMQPMAGRAIMDRFNNGGNTPWHQSAAAAYQDSIPAAGYGPAWAKNSSGPLDNGPMQPMGGMPSGMPAGQSFSQNPYTSMMAGELSRQVGRFTGDRLAGIRRGAIMAGGLGGSRQGAAEGTAIADGSAALGGQLANLYSGQFNTDRNYGLQSDQLDANIYNMNQNWMRTGQQDQLNFMDRMLGWNQQGLNTATQAQNTPLNYYSQFTNLGTQLGGMGGTQSQNMQGNPWLGAIGGAVTGANLYNQWNKPQGA